MKHHLTFFGVAIFPMFIIILIAFINILSLMETTKLHYDICPQHHRLYGTPGTHLRPIYLGKDERGHKIYGFIIHPDKEGGYLIEGAGRHGQDSYMSLKRQLKMGNFKNTVYLYSVESLNHATLKQAEDITNWAKYADTVFLQTLTK